MGYPKRNDTLGDLIRSGSGITAYCQAQHCDQGVMDVDVYNLVMLFGTRSRYVSAQWPLKCSACESKDVTFRVAPEHLPRETAMRTPPRNFRESQTEQERIALEILFPREWD